MPQPQICTYFVWDAWVLLIPIYLRRIFLVKGRKRWRIKGWVAAVSSVCAAVVLIREVDSRADTPLFMGTESLLEKDMFLWEAAHAPKNPLPRWLRFALQIEDMPIQTQALVTRVAASSAYRYTLC